MASFVRIMKISQLVLILMSSMVFFLDQTNGICATYRLPVGCKCTNDTSGQVMEVRCENANLSFLPPGLPPAIHMRFENNSIDVIDGVPYPDTIRYLFLPQNKIRLVRDGAFHNLSKLNTLSLKANEITSLRKTTFVGLDNLKTLVLMDNPIYALRADTLDGMILPQLEDLNMDSCRLYEFEDGALDSLGNLKFLTLSHNNLHDMPIIGCPGHSLEYLITFDISHNRITHLEPSTCYLPRLHHLNLDHNRIETLNSSFYGSSMKYLRSLRLSHNIISTINHRAFDESQNLTTLDISYNNLTMVFSETIPWNQVRSVMVSGNPWNCDCENMWLISHEQVSTLNRKETVRCATPEKVFNKSVFSVYKTAFEHCQSKNHTLAFAIGGVCVVLAVIIACTVLYFVVRKQGTHDDIGGSSSSGNRTGSSIYRRMNTGNEVLFDYSSGAGTESREVEQRPVWKEMDAYEQNNNPYV